MPPPRRSGASAKAASVLPVALPALGIGKHRQHAAPVVLLASGIGSNADVLPRDAAGPASREALLAA